MAFEGLQRDDKWVLKETGRLHVDLPYSDSNTSFLMRYLAGVRPSMGCALDQLRAIQHCARNQRPSRAHLPSHLHPTHARVSPPDCFQGAWKSSSPTSSPAQRSKCERGAEAQVDYFASPRSSVCQLPTLASPLRLCCARAPCKRPGISSRHHVRCLGHAKSSCERAARALAFTYDRRRDCARCVRRLMQCLTGSFSPRPLSLRTPLGSTST